MRAAGRRAPYGRCVSSKAKHGCGAVRTGGSSNRPEKRNLVGPLIHSRNGGGAVDQNHRVERIDPILPAAAALRLVGPLRFSAATLLFSALAPAPTGHGCAGVARNTPPGHHAAASSHLDGPRHRRRSSSRHACRTSSRGAAACGRTTYFGKSPAASPTRGGTMLG